MALIILIWFPLTEGRATHLDLFSTYADPFILYGYGASIAFFVALYNALCSSKSLQSLLKTLYFAQYNRAT